MELPDTYAWDEWDMLDSDTAAEQAAARRAEVVKAQVDSFDDDYMMCLYTSGSIWGHTGKHEA